MTALIAVATFFLIYVIVFIVISAVLSAAAWWMGRRAAKTSHAQSAAEIERKLDQLKDKAFVVSIILTFFIVTPFVVIYLFIGA